MNENILEEIVAESYRREYKQYDNAPEHNFSIKHKLNMKRIFARYARNVNKIKQIQPKRHLEETTHSHNLSLRQKLFVAVLIIVLMSLLVGWIAVYISKDFHGTVYHDYTHLTVVNTDDCPQTIEHKYFLPEIPEGFELVETVSSSIAEYNKYTNSLTNETFAITQHVKKSYSSNYNTEHKNINEVEINGHIGQYIDFSDNEFNSSLLVWDNGDYIIELGGDLPKDALVNLAKSAKK